MRSTPRLRARIALVAFWTALGIVLPCAASARLDSFVCRTAVPAKKAKLAPPQVHLVDEFAAGDFQAKPPASLCEPVAELGEMVADPGIRFVAYGLKATGKPKKPAGSAEMTDRFGTMQIVAVAADRLLVPGGACNASACGGADPLDHYVDAYECYRAKLAEKSQPIRSVPIVGASGTVTVYDLTRPARICMPVAMDDDAMEAPQTHLTCYQAVRAKKICAATAPVNAYRACKREEDCGGVKGQTTLCARQARAASVPDVEVATALGGVRLRVKAKEEVCVPPGGRPASLDVGPDGGTLSLGRFEVVVPPDVLPDVVRIAVHELPSQAEEVARDLDPEQFRPLGPVYELQAPFRSTVPLALSLAWDDADIPAGFAIENLAILYRDDAPWLEDTSGAETVDARVRPLFSPGVASVDAAAHRVRLGISGGGTFQLVAMAAPIQSIEESAMTAGSASIVGGTGAALGAPQTPSFRVEFVGTLPDVNFANLALFGLKAAYQELVVKRGFPAPIAQVVVKVQSISKISKVQSGVSASDPLVIYADPNLYLRHDVAVTMAHEYFHVIQFWNSNEASAHDQGANKNRWFFEGSADWAADEVFDVAQGEYSAPDGTYFARSMNAEMERGDPHAYDSVVFWKWLESVAPGAVRGVIVDHGARTHSATSPTVNVQNDTEALILDTLTALYSNVLGFIDFAAAALYWKSFDTDETGPRDLWASDRLGPAKQVPKSFTDGDAVKTLRRGGDGDGEANKLQVLYQVAPHLTADVHVIANSAGSDALSGTLYVEFEAPDDPHLEAAVINSDTDEEMQVLDLSTRRRVSLPFDAGTKVVVIDVDPQWEAPQVTNPQFQVFNVWVEPCGGATNGTVTKVASDAALVAALLTAGAGDTVLMAPGTYHPVSREWPDGSFAPIQVPPGVTLAGTPGATTIVLPGPSVEGWTWIEPLEDATLRDLTLVASDIGIYYAGVHKVSLCNVIGQYQYTPPGGGFWLAMTPFEGDYILDVYGGSYTCLGCPTEAEEYGFWIQSPYVASGADSVTTLLRIRNSSISSWYASVYYCSFEDCGQVTVDADCSQFHGNQFAILDETANQDVDRCP